MPRAQKLLVSPISVTFELKIKAYNSPLKGQDLKHNQTSSCSAEAMISYSNKAARCDRERVRCLGGVYQSDFNYRREILGRFQTKEHCYMCMAKKDTEGQALKSWMWNMLVCPDCVKEWTICKLPAQDHRISRVRET